MKKLCISILVMALSLYIIPVSAFADENHVMPLASFSISGYLSYDESTASYWICGRCIGNIEEKHVRATLYRRIASRWEYIDSVESTGSTSQVIAEKKVSVSTGEYKLVIYGESSTTSNSTQYYYSIY